MTKPNKHSRLAYLLWRDRVWQDELGQQHRQLCLLSRIKPPFKAIWHSTHWSVTGVYTASLAFVVALATSWVSGKNDDAARVQYMQQTDAGVILLECSPDVGRELLRCKQVGRQRDHHNITGPQNNPASNVNAQKQAAAQEK